jgi:serine/threonine protein kinase/ABC-type phosphate transport system substrate-binding protein
MPTDDVDSPSGTNEANSPRIIGDYILKNLLGGGENSSTFSGTKRNTDETVAIKVFSKSSSISKNLYQSELRAYETLRGQAGILQHKDNGETEEAYFIVTEFVKEGSLRHVLESVPEGMNIEQVIQIFTPLAAAIDCIHDNNIVHRDLKPENILIRNTSVGYEVFIADFGIVKFTGDLKQFHTEKTAGTWKYIPPEAWTADPETPQTQAVDIYTFGIMLYEALEGKLPFDDINDVLSGSVPTPEQAKRKTNANVVEYLLMPLNKNPDQRPASATAIIDSIRNAYHRNLNQPQKWVGREIKNYRVEAVLGTGRMGISLLAVDTKTGQPCVLKAFEYSLFGNPVQAFDHEIKSLKRLETGHNVLTPQESFEHDGALFIVTDYQSGGTLRHLINRKPKLTIKEILEIFTQLAEAIDYIHENKIIHRDIKPENVVYSISDKKINVFLTDFGISVIIATTNSYFETTDGAGTFRYMAPELWNPKAKKTKAVDIYAFGILLYEALEGHLPFTAEPPAIMNEHMNSPVPTPKNTLKQLGSDAQNILLQALAKNPEERPKTATEIIQQLKGQYTKFLGKKFGKYVIDKFIGRGVYGATYQAHSIQYRRKKFALKILSIPRPDLQEIGKLREISKFNGVLPIIDVASENDIHYIVTSYLSGNSLRDMLQDSSHAIGLDEVLRIFKPIAEALDSLHGEEVIHGDLKPENVVFNKHRDEENSVQPFITDYGISRIAGKNQAPYFKVNFPLGNFAYMAPEVWDDREPTHASDIYAFGVMLYEALEGTLPFKAKSLAGIMRQHLDETPPVPQNLLRQAGSNAVNVLLQSLNKQPEHRQKTAGEVILALEKVAHNQTSTAAGRITGPVMANLSPLMNFGKKKLEISVSRLGAVLTVLIVLFGLILNQTTRLPPLTPAGTTAVPSMTISPTSTTSATETPPSPTVTLAATRSIPVTAPTLHPCDLQYSLTQEECDYSAGETISLEKLYTQFYGNRLSEHDLQAIAYFNNRRALEEPRYNTIDPKSLKIEKGSKIFLPSLEAIAVYNEFPRPVLEKKPEVDAFSEITISGSSALEPLTSELTEGFEQTTKYKVNIRSNNTELGMADFCQSKAQLFGVSEMKLINCPNVTFLKFEIARYAVVIFINQNNSNWSKLIEEPLNTGELNRLLTTAETWREVREEFTDDAITRYYPAPDSAAFEIVRNEIFPTIDPNSPNSILSLEHLDENLIPERVFRDEYSIGFASYFTYRNNIDSLQAISVNRVPPNRDTIQKEIPAYPLTRQLYLYTGEVTYEEDPLVRFFIDYYLSYELDHLDELGFFRPSKRGFLDNPYTTP